LADNDHNDRERGRPARIRDEAGKTEAGKTGNAADVFREIQSFDDEDAEDADRRLREALDPLLAEPIPDRLLKLVDDLRQRLTVKGGDPEGGDQNPSDQDDT
jgi:hypothetical protein